MILQFIPSSPLHLSPTPVFLQEFTLLSIAVTTFHAFLVIGDFNIYVDNPSYSFVSKFLRLLSSTYLVKPVNFATHCHALSPLIHYLIFTGLNTVPTRHPDPV